MSDDEMSMGEVRRCLERMERMLDAVTSDHEKRLRWLERVAWGALATGTTGAFSGLWAMFGGG